MSVQVFKSAITVAKWVKISGMQEDGYANLKANRYFFSLITIVMLLEQLL